MVVIIIGTLITQTMNHWTLVLLPFSPSLCDCPTLGNCQTWKSRIAKLRDMKNCNYNHLLTYYTTSGL